MAQADIVARLRAASTDLTVAADEIERRRSEKTITLSSLKVAKLCEKNHDLVVRDILALGVKFYGDLSNLKRQGLTIDYDPGGYVTEIHLDKFHAVMLLCTYEQPELRKYVATHWLEIEPAVPTMSSVEIAELCEKQHKHVMRDIRIMLGKLNQPKPGPVDSDGLADFEGTYFDAKGEERPCFYLPRRECLVLVTGYSIPLRARIIDRWEELEGRQNGERAATISIEMEAG